MKDNRHQAILDIIETSLVATQKDLVDLLRGRGYTVTQATVSRDIGELGLRKLPDDEGHYRYQAPSNKAEGLGQDRDRLDRTIADVVVSVDYTENLLVIKTVPGSAQLLAFLLDQSQDLEMMGTIAGDDVVLLIIKDKSRVPHVCKDIKDKMES